MIRYQSGGLRICAAAVVVAGIAMLWGCGPKPSPSEAQRPPRPGRPSITAFADRFEISWRTNRRTDQATSGYYVYYWVEPSSTPPAAPAWTVPEPLASDRIRILHAGLYPGDTDPRTDIETATVDDLTMGQRYGVLITTVGPTGVASRPSEAAYAVVRPRGTFELSARFSGGNEGFSLSRGESVGSLSEFNDLYLFDSREGPVLASPSRLDPLLRKSLFYDIGRHAAFDDVSKVDAADGRGRSRVAIDVGSVIVVVTDEQRQAKLRVRSIDGGDRQLRVGLDYVYQPRVDEDGF